MKTKWIHSSEKKQLKKDIIDGVVTDDMTAAFVYNMRDGSYHKFPYNRFKVNLKNLQLAIKKLQNSSADDAIALENASQQWPIQNDPPNYPPWHNSRAKLLLLTDINSGTIEGLPPTEVRLMRPEYLEYPLKVFRDHLNKEKKSP
jgi:hypothetical protein